LQQSTDDLQPFHTAEPSRPFEPLALGKMAWRGARSTCCLKATPPGNPQHRPTFYVEIEAEWMDGLLKQGCVENRKRTTMCRYAFFASAPTVRFLKLMERVEDLEPKKRRRVAASIYSRIKPLVSSDEPDELRTAAELAQAERWRLISQGISEIADERFAPAAIAEQWLRARLENIRAQSPVAEILAERRCRAVEQFLRNNLSFQDGEIVELRPRALPITSDNGCDVLLSA
jgi:hypothetical protein